MTVVQQLVECLVSFLDQVLPASVDEPDERGLGNREEAQRVGQSDCDRLRSPAGVTGLELRLPLIESGGMAAALQILIRDVIGPPAKRIRRVYGSTLAAGEESKAGGTI